MSDNVIKGPWPAIYKPNAEDKEVIALAEDLITEMSSALFEGISNAGFDNFDDMCYSKDYALMVHSIRSAIYKLNGQYHPLQDVADNLFIQYEDGSLQTAHSVHVDFE
jgi:hypothetical protein